jgi:hypothetical protein
MDEDFSIQCLPDYLLVEHPSEIDLSVEVINKFWTALKAACKSTSHKHVLCAGRIARRTLKMLDIFDTASMAGRVALGLKMACVFENYTPDERTALFKMVALRHGAIVEFFSSREEAITWLSVGS